MDQFHRIETKERDARDEASAILDNVHAEAVAFVEKHREYYEHYARGRVRFAPAPEGLNTFAFDLEKDTIYVNAKFYKDRGYSDERTSFAIHHEIEHFLEKKELVLGEGGDRAFETYLKKLERSKAFGLMDNCVADVRENRTVVDKTHEGFREIEQKCYKEDLFKETDFTAEPKHVQFCYALLREARVPDEVCTIDPVVREKLNDLKAIRSKSTSVGTAGTNLFDVMTRPQTPMSTRLKLQDRFVWPIVKELLEEDLKKASEQKKEAGQQGGGGEAGKSVDAKDGDGKVSPKGKPNPDEVFKEAYARAEKKVPNAVPIDEIKKAFEAWKKAQGENASQKADKEYADKLGVKAEDLKKYRDIVKSFDALVNPETNETVVAELRTLISRIISQRLRPSLAPRYPLEEGEDLVDPAQLVADVRGGNFEPKVWETVEVKEKRGQKFGEIEITLVCDRSSSMAEGGGEKRDEQQKAAVLMMEALKEFAEIADAERVNMDTPLEVRSEVYSFQADARDAVALKKMSKELGEKERVDICGILSSVPGSTTDFVPLETIAGTIDEEVKKKLAEGELKKIVIVFTDGGSDNPARVQVALESLRACGVVAIGVGITESGLPALDTYKPNARLAKTASELPLVLGELLKEHLANV